MRGRDGIDSKKPLPLARQLRPESIDFRFKMRNDVQRGSEEEYFTYWVLKCRKWWKLILSRHGTFEHSNRQSIVGSISTAGTWDSVDKCVMVSTDTCRPNGRMFLSHQSDFLKDHGFWVYMNVHGRPMSCCKLKVV